MQSEKGHVITMERQHAQGSFGTEMRLLKCGSRDMLREEHIGKVISNDSSAAEIQICITQTLSSHRTTFAIQT